MRSVASLYANESAMRDRERSVISLLMLMRVSHAIE